MLETSTPAVSGDQAVCEQIERAPIGSHPADDLTEMFHWLNRLAALFRVSEALPRCACMANGYSGKSEHTSGDRRCHRPHRLRRVCADLRLTIQSSADQDRLTQARHSGIWDRLDPSDHPLIRRKRMTKCHTDATAVDRFGTQTDASERTG